MPSTPTSHSDANRKPWIYWLAKRIINGINTLNSLCGRIAGWLSVLLVVLISYIVVSRALFDMGSLALQETVTYGHATLFMLCMAYTLIQRGHVRVDVFYRRFSLVNKAWVDAIGGLLLLLPFALFITFISWDFVVRSWEIRETSSDPGGLPLVFLLKTMIPITGILLSLQAVSEIVSNLLAITFVGEESIKEGKDSPC